MKPVRSTLNWPLRVYETPPLASLTSKKPLPLIARSSGLSVAVIVPWVNCCATAATETPMPTEFWLPPSALA